MSNEATTVEPLRISDAEVERLRPAKAYLESNAIKGATFHEAAKLVGLSPFHFHRRFTLAFGVTPKDVASAAQVAEAQRLMLAGVALAAIAAPCGFAHQSHFAYRFKQITGQTPTAWLRANRQQAHAAEAA